jgi:hypothetical protein
MIIVFELSDLFSIDIKFKNILIKTCKILGWALKNKFFIMIGKSILGFFSIISIRKEIKEFFVNNQ